MGSPPASTLRHSLAFPLLKPNKLKVKVNPESIRQKRRGGGCALANIWRRAVSRNARINTHDARCYYIYTGFETLCRR